MNYYIITPEVFETLDKDNVDFKLLNLDKTQVLISTTDSVSSSIEEFENITACSNYTYTNHADWLGNGAGVDEMTIQEMIYIEEIEP